MKRWITFITLGVLGTISLYADQPLVWPRFRGPNGSGIADGQKPPVEFGPNKNVKWKVAVPSGLSSPIVAGENLVITAFEDGKLYTIAYRRKDGKEAWRARAPAKKIEGYHMTEGSPAASTPVTDGKRIVTYFGSCGLVCYDLSGKQLWKFEMPPAGVARDFGSGVSPILADGLVILVRDANEDSRIIAFDAIRGTQRWERKRMSPTSWCTPVVWENTSGKQVVSAGHGRIIGYDLKTGEEKWFVIGMPAACCSSPVAADNGNLYYAGWSPGGAEDKEFQMPAFDDLLKDLDKDKSGDLSRDEAEKAFEGLFDNQDMNGDGKITRNEWEILAKFMAEGKSSAFAVKAGGTGDVTNSHVLWKQTKGLPFVASAIVYRGQYVMVKDGGIVTAYNAVTGNQIYEERVAAGGSYYASPVAANGHIYFTSLSTGTVTVLKAASDKPAVVAKNELGERSAATPAIADDTLYVRTEKHLYAFNNKK